MVESSNLSGPIIKRTNMPYLAVYSTDNKFMSNLIDWINNQTVAKDSTIVRLHDMDPYEEVDLLKAQIEGMTVRIYDLESKLNDSSIQTIDA